jgi:hypothetical protein
MLVAIRNIYRIATKNEPVLKSLIKVCVINSEYYEIIYMYNYYVVFNIF